MSDSWCVIPYTGSGLHSEVFKESLDSIIYILTKENDFIDLKVSGMFSFHV
ncbi:unnamed protein product [Arabidopsis halleri]